MSAIEQDIIEVDPDTKEMLKVLVSLMRGHRGFLLEVPSRAGMFSPGAANPT